VTSGGEEEGTLGEKKKGTNREIGKRAKEGAGVTKTDALKKNHTGRKKPAGTDKTLTKGRGNGHPHTKDGKLIKKVSHPRRDKKKRLFTANCRLCREAKCWKPWGRETKFSTKICPGMSGRVGKVLFKGANGKCSRHLPGV